MEKLRNYSFALVLVGLLFFPASASVKANTVTDEAVYRETLLQLITLLQAQIVALQAELNLADTKQKIEVNDLGILSRSIDIVAVYPVSAADVSDINNQKHRRYFSRVFDIFPSEYDEVISKVLVFDGSDSGGFDAYVETLPPNHETWLYATNQEVVPKYNSEATADLIIHELGHIVSYEEIIGVPNPAQTKCASYFKKYGCPAHNSFLAQFVDNFWTDDDLERAEGWISQTYQADAVGDYFSDHSDRFVTEYAASSPEEDFSESFNFFVNSEEVSGEEAQAKIDWFNRYTKMLELREEILDNK